jgi:amino acid transporter
MLMASRLVYGMSREQVLPDALGKVHPARRPPHVAIALTTLVAFALITFVGEIPVLAGTTALVNIAVVVLRRARVDHEHFRSPAMLPVAGVLSCAFLVGLWTGREPVQYAIAGVLIAIGNVLWLATVLLNRASGHASGE